jgi:sarcosine oxidase
LQLIESLLKREHIWKLSWYRFPLHSTHEPDRNCGEGAHHRDYYYSDNSEISYIWIHLVLMIDSQELGFAAEPLARTHTRSLTFLTESTLDGFPAALQVSEMISSSRRYDVIVVGLGAMGSATLYHLARRGVRVLGLEQFAPLHDKGSSHGDSRIIRETYFEHPLYVPLVQRAHELWRELEAATGESLLTVNGGLMIGPSDWSVVSGTLRSAREHGLPHEILSLTELSKTFAPFEVDASCVAVFDPRAGYLDPEACTQAHIDLAKNAGAVARFNERMLSWDTSGQDVRIVTTGGTYEGEKLVLTTGSWIGSLLGDLHLPLEIERQTVFWFETPAPPTAYASSNFPIYAYEFKPGVICYGFPELTKGVKASVMHDGAVVASPEKIDRAVAQPDLNALRAALSGVLPRLAAAGVRSSTTCIFTNTPDHDFVIDFHPRHGNVLISSPCSGHGFKFASAIGELQADLLTRGQSSFDLTPFRLDRFLGGETRTAAAAD